MSLPLLLEKGFKAGDSSVYVEKIGYVSCETLKIKTQDKNICNIRVEELSEKFNNSISGYF